MVTRPPKDRLIVALDFASEAVALDLVDRLGEQVAFYKVGLQLFTAAGPNIVRRLVGRGKNVFLDLKLHEIPNSVALATKAAGDLGVAMLTVHASAGSKAMSAAAEAAASFPSLKVVAITVVTSLTDGDLREIGVGATCDEQVLRLATLAEASGCHGVVSSPREVPILRRTLGASLAFVTPGVRPAQSLRQDQERVATPYDAIRNGATHLVIGRPITQDADPAAATASILDEIASAEAAL